MKLITIRGQIKEVAEDWSKQMLKGIPDESHLEIYRMLRSLDTEKCASEDVEKIIGNKSWVCEKDCSECQSKFETVIRLDDSYFRNPNSTSGNAVYLCQNCVRKALEVLEKEETPNAC